MMAMTTAPMRKTGPASKGRPPKVTYSQEGEHHQEGRRDEGEPDQRGTQHAPWK